MGRQSSSDPLPFIQLDRSVEPIAAMLAGHLKVSHQHAIGSLYGFWKLCAEPRELERIVERAGGGTPSLELDAHDIALRFELASGARVEPVVLARLGLLEPLEGTQFRVRGMSRYLDAIAARSRARKAAAAGGKARAQAPRAADGSFLPLDASAGESAGDGWMKSETAGESAGESAGLSQPKPSPRGQRSEDRDKETTMSSLPLDLSAPVTVRPEQLEDKLTDAEFQVFEHWRVTLKHQRAKATPERKRLIAKALKAYTVEELQQAITGVTRSPHHMGQNDRHTRYDDLELILRDAKHIEGFIRLGAT